MKHQLLIPDLVAFAKELAGELDKAGVPSTTATEGGVTVHAWRTDGGIGIAIDIGLPRVLPVAPAILVAIPGGRRR